jgi:hypothetical protein
LCDGAFNNNNNNKNTIMSRGLEIEPKLELGFE